MKLKVLAVTLVAAMTMSMATCGGSNNTTGNGEQQTTTVQHEITAQMHQMM